jgi:hypothetical protein
VNIAAHAPVWLNFLRNVAVSISLKVEMSRPWPCAEARVICLFPSEAQRALGSGLGLLKVTAGRSNYREAGNKPTRHGDFFEFLYYTIFVLK